MSDNNGERRSFRSGGSTPWSGRKERAERPEAQDTEAGGRPQNRRDDDRRSGYGSGGHSSARRDDRRSNDTGDRPHRGRPDNGRSDNDRRGRDNQRRDDRPRSGDRDRQFSDRNSGGREHSRGDRPYGDRDNRRGKPTDDRRSGPPPRRRGGEGAFGAGRGREGIAPQRREARPDEPDLPDDVEAAELDPTIRRDLLSLDKANANTVARHLVMAGRLLDDDPRSALAHARAARQRAGRIAVVREAAGITAYHAGEWAEALSELRAARRMSGGTGLLAVMADCERGLGRPEKAIELGRSEEARALTGDDAAELRIVVAGARMDLGQYDQAVVTLQTPDLDPNRVGTPAARLFYAYADALVAAGRTEEGLQWFLHSAAADFEGVTDAEERVEELTGDSR